MCRSLKKRDIWQYLVLFCTEFADIEDLNGQDDTSRMDGICDFLWRKFVMGNIKLSFMGDKIWELRSVHIVEKKQKEKLK